MREGRKLSMPPHCHPAGIGIGAASAGLTSLDMVVRRFGEGMHIFLPEAVPAVAMRWPWEVHPLWRCRAPHSCRSTQSQPC